MIHLLVKSLRKFSSFTASINHITNSFIYCIILFYFLFLYETTECNADMLLSLIVKRVTGEGFVSGLTSLTMKLQISNDNLESLSCLV